MGLDNPLHIVFLLIMVLLVFGAKRLPEMGRSLGEGLRGFKTAIGDEHPTPAPAVIAPAGVHTVAHAQPAVNNTEAVASGDS